MRVGNKENEEKIIKTQTIAPTCNNFEQFQEVFCMDVCSLEHVWFAVYFKRNYHCTSKTCAMMIAGFCVNQFGHIGTCT